MSLLEAKNITKEYGGRTIIRDICIHLEQGELVSILGLSGCGKTTLFHVLSGLTLPKEGQVFLNGEDITGKPGSVSYMLQKDLLLQHKKVIDNVALPLVLKGMSRKNAGKIASPLFAPFGLEGCQNQFPSSLSGGMRQRAAFLRTCLCAAIQADGVPRTDGSGWGSALFCDQDADAEDRGREIHGAALLDEPFSALDTITKGQMHDWYLGVMKKISLSTLFITHDIDEAILLSDRIYLMTGTPGVIRNEIEILPSRKEREGFNLTQEFLMYKKRIVRILGEENL